MRASVTASVIAGSATFLIGGGLQMTGYINPVLGWVLVGVGALLLVYAAIMGWRDKYRKRPVADAVAGAIDAAKAKPDLVRRIKAKFKNVRMEGFDTGVKARGNVDIDAEDVEMKDVKTGFDLDSEHDGEDKEKDR